MSDLSSIWTKSNCLSRNQLQQYLQQKLDREEEYLVESHLNDCSFCSDALEGLMHVEQEQATRHLDELKADFTKKLEAIKPEEKKTKIVSLPTEPHAKPDSPVKPLTSGKRFRWAYAASILLVVGLGYSVFSFIKEYQAKKEVSHTMDAKISSADKSYTAVQDSSTERIHLELRPDELAVEPSGELKKAVSESQKSISPQSPDTKPIAADKMVRETTKSKDAVTTEAPAYASKNADAKPEPVAMAEKESMDDYREDNAKLEKVTKSLSAGKPGGGMKKSNAPQVQSPSANQMNYSSNAMQNKGSQEELSETVAVSESKKTEAVSDYDEALSFYQKGNYRKAIRKFERLLPQSTGTRREDILYHLAQCHLESGNERQAATYFAQLTQSPRYGKKAAESMKVLKK